MRGTELRKYLEENGKRCLSVCNFHHRLRGDEVSKSIEAP